MNPRVIHWRVRVSNEVLRRAADDNFLGPEWPTETEEQTADE